MSGTEQRTRSWTLKSRDDGRWTGERPLLACVPRLHVVAFVGALSRKLVKDAPIPPPTNKKKGSDDWSLFFFTF